MAQTGIYLSLLKEHQHQRYSIFRSHRPSFRNRTKQTCTFYFTQVSDMEAWRQRKGALHERPADFEAERYASFSVKEVVEDPVDSEHIHEYVEKSRLSRRLGF